jgi:hypothetical protein
MARFELEPEVAETGLQSGVRNVARGIARAGEAALGAPGDILSGALGLGEYAAKKIGATKPTVFEQARKIVPTSETVRKYATENIAKFLPEGYLEPQSNYEKLADELIGDFVSFITPTTGPLKLGAKTAAKIAGAGTAAKFGAQQLDLGEGTQEGVKLGAMLATSLGGRPKLDAYKNSLYEAARENLPEGARVSASELSPAIKAVEKRATLGHASAAEKEAIDYLRSVEDKISGKTIPLDSVWQLKKDLNEMAFKSSKVAETKAAQQLLRPVKDALGKTIEGARTQFPAFVNNLSMADEIHRAVNASGPLGQFLRDNIKFDAFKSPLTSALLGGAYYAGMPVIKTGVGAAVGKNLYLAGEAALKSPEVRKYYAKTVGAALKENVTQTKKFSRLLDDSLSKEQAKESPEGRYILSS